MDTVQKSSSTLYKGKVLRSWNQLPAELIRLIATYYILDLSAYGYTPSTYESSEQWARRMIYTVVRDALEVQKLMSICPTWGSALESHGFWHQACSVLDPTNTFAQQRFIQTSAPTGASNATPTFIQVSPHRHFQTISRYTCVVCRINNPWLTIAVGGIKRYSTTAWLGFIPVCRDHRKASFCGVCLREAPPLDVETDYSYVCCVENDDEETWPGIDATCRSCRVETLWRLSGYRRGDRDAIGGSSLESPDWETRQAVESFIEMGEGTIHDVLNTAREKFWMRRHTKLADMLSQALAANRYATRTEAGEAGYVSDEDMSDEEDDLELLSLTEDSGGVKELAMFDWTRSRILDGYWISPYDHWNDFVTFGGGVVPTEHPCPWNKDATFTGALEEGETGVDGEELIHPRPKTVAVPQPPTESLSEFAHKAYLRAMHNVLSPAMRNLVRKIVIECTADGVDPALKASRMSLEDVIRELRDEAMWFNGIDWIERRANRAREDSTRGSSGTTDEDDCSSSSRSEGSHTTSPVLSTTTLQTTPSPPPSGDSTSKEDDSTASASSPTTTSTTNLVPAPPSSAPAIPIPVAPVLKSPTLIHPIPYIPVTITHLPRHSYAAVWAVWREAVAPLFQCRCSICERTMLKLNIANGTIIPTQTQDTTTAQPQQVAPIPTYQYPIQPPQKPVEIQLDEAISRGDLTVMPEFQADQAVAESPVKDSKQYRESFRGRAQTPGPEPRKRPPLAEEDEETDEENDSIIDYDGSESESSSPPLFKVEINDKSLPMTPKKRSSQELDGEAVETGSFARTGSPPKRLRVDGAYSPARVATPPLTPSRMRKRSSEELEDGNENNRSSPTGDAKRLKSSDPSTERLDRIRAITAEAKLRI